MVRGSEVVILRGDYAVVVIGDRCTRAFISLIDLHEVSVGGGLIGGSGTAIGLILGDGHVVVVIGYR